MRKIIDEDVFHKRLHGLREDIDYEEIHGIQIYRNTNTIHFDPHWHPAIEILYPVKEGYTVRIDAQETLLAPGDILIIPPGTIHAYTPPRHGERYFFLLDYNENRRIEGLDLLMQSLTPFLLVSQTAFPLLNEALQAILHHVIEEYLADKPFADAMISAKLTELLATVGRANIYRASHTKDFPKDRRQEYVTKFMHVCNYIADHFDENLTTEQLARIADFSRFHFSRLFREFTGMSCHEYLIHQRLNAAEQLLRQPDLSITDIAMRTGFDSPSAFARTFKAKRGMSPTKHRALLRKNDEAHG